MDINGSIMESSNDILTEILVRLPPKSIFKFTCVSRRWNNLIMDPCFIKRYDSGRRRKGSSGGKLLGFVQCNIMRLASGTYMFQPWVSRHSFLSVSEGHSGRFPRELGYFISASNGLFLCGCIPTTYHVGNPMTKRWVSLPTPHQLFPDRAISVGLACEEGSNSYQVVVAGTSHDAYYYDNMPIETYSSITGEWRESILIGPYPFGIAPHKPPIVCGGVFHWLTKQGVLVVYDSSSLEEERGGEREKKNLVQLIKLPWGGGSHIVWRTDNGQTLWFGGSNLHNLKIFLLPMGKHSSSSSISSDEWTLVHTVAMDTLMKDLIPVTAKDITMEKCHVASQRSTRKTRWILYEHRSFVYMVAFIPWDPRLVLVRLRERIFLYNWENNTMNSVQLHGYPSFTDFEWEWYPYFDSVSLSSYAFGLPQQQQ
ncbi:hypothetical protein LguiA_029686 [Lonicera macranthoides]